LAQEALVVQAVEPVAGRVQILYLVPLLLWAVALEYGVLVLIQLAQQVALAVRRFNMERKLLALALQTKVITLVPAL
jgi:hypothetical protein